MQGDAGIAKWILRMAEKAGVSTPEKRLPIGRRDQSHSPGEPENLRKPANSCRTAFQGDTLWGKAGEPVDVREPNSRQAETAFSSHHAVQAYVSGGGERASAIVSSADAELSLGIGYYVRADRGRLVVFGGGDGSVSAPDRGVVHEFVAEEIDYAECAANGDRSEKSIGRLIASFGSGRSICL